MGSAETPDLSARPRSRHFWKSIRRRIATATLAACLLAFTASSFAAGLLGSSHGGPVPNLAPLPTPGTGSVPALGSGSAPDPGTILGPSLSIPLSAPALRPLNDPLASLPNVGSDLPAGVSPELKDL